MSSFVELRLTSVWEYSPKWAVFSGVPLVKKGFRARSGRTVVVVKTHPELLPMEPLVGQHWRVHGPVEERKAEHGDFIVTERHFIKPQKLEVTLPHDGEDFIRFIAREPDFKGIGEVKARELWHTFGKGVFELLKSNDQAALQRVLTPLAADSLLEGFEKYANLRYATWFADHHIPPQIQQRLFKYHGTDAIKTIHDNPYHLISFGIAFDKADALAQERFGLKKDDKRRLLAAVEYALRRHASRGGHTVAKHRDIAGRVRRVLGDTDLAAAALQQGHRSQAFILDAETGNYHSTPLLIMEKVVAKRLLKLRDQTRNWGFEHDLALGNAVRDLPYPLMEKQHEAVISALAHSVSCITGGAGTGKTTVLRTVLKEYDRLGYEIKAVALSGRAAKRLHESIGFETSTIAKLLKDEPIAHESKTVLVIDEASMVDLGTMYRIVNHLHPSVRMVFVGDPDQLPPIGAGLILADIIRSGEIPNVELDVVKRQDATSGIPEYSRLIRRGEIPAELSMGCITFHEVSPEKVDNTCATLFSENPVDSQVLAATRAMTQAINQLCQEQLNADAVKLEFTEFGAQFTTDLRQNDPVLFTQNNYDAGIQNGSLGTLTSVEQTGKHFGIVRLADNGEEIPLTKSLLDSLLPGYGITLHKAQGSQFKRVIVALSATSMIDRAWLYTAITRAEIELHLVGTKEKMHKACRSLSAHHIRQTHLHKLLGGY